MRRLVVMSAIAILLGVGAAAQDASPGILDWLFGTAEEADRQEDQGGFLEQLIEDNLSGEGRHVEISGFQGALSGRATLDTMTIADRDGVWLTLSDAVLDWNRGALLSGRIEVAELSAETIVLSRPPLPSGNGLPSPEAPGFSLPELPVAVKLGRILADRVEIGAPVLGVAVDARIDGSLGLEGGEGAARLDIRRLDAGGSLTLDAGYSNATGALRLDLALTEGRDGIFANLAGLPGRPPVDFSVRGEGPLDAFAADIRLATEGVERLAGRVVTEAPLQEDGPTLQVRAELAGDIAPVFAPDYRGFFGPEVALQSVLSIYADGRKVLDDLRISSGTMFLEGSVEIGSDGLPERIALAGEIADPTGAPVLLPLPGHETRVQRAGLAVAFDAAQGELWTGDIDIAGLDRPGFAARALKLSGTGRIAETPVREVTAELRFDAAALDLGDPDAARALGESVTGRARITWREGGPVRLENIAVAGQTYNARGAAEITLGEAGPVIDGSAKLGVSRLEVFSGIAGRELGGSMELGLDFGWTPLAGVFDVEAEGRGSDLTVSEPLLDRILAGGVDVALAAARDENGVRLGIDRFASANAELSGKAELKTDASDIDLTAKVSDAALIHDGLTGPVRVSVTAREEGRNWVWSLDAALPDATLVARGNAVDPFENPVLGGSGRLEFTDLSVFSGIARRQLGGSGAIAFSGELARDLSRFDVEATVRGTSLAVGMAEIDRLIGGDLSAELEIARAADTVKIAAFRLSTELLDAAASGAVGPEGGRIELSARISDVAPFAPGFSGPLAATGEIGRAAGSEGLTVAVEAKGPGGASARVTGSAAADFSSVDLVVSGSAPLGLANGLIAPQSLSGTVGFELGLSGPPMLQGLRGRVSASGARLVTPAMPITLEDIAFNADISGAVARISMTARAAAGGILSAEGPIALTPPFAADLSARLREVVLSDPRLFVTTVGGDIQIGGALAGGARIGGDLRLGETTIRIPSTGLAGAGDIPEIIHVGEPPAVRATRARAGLLGSDATTQTTAAYPLDIRIEAPNRIFVRGRGLDSEFGGRIRITGTTRDVIPVGAFNLIRGRLDILGRRLEITEATITAQGSFVPVLDVRAETTAEDTAIVVRVQGPADNPEITFASNPELPEEEVLARLIFGRGLESLSPLQAARLALAIRTLAGKGGEGAVGRIRQGAGLADLDVTTDAEGNAAVRAGAYLGENLYTDVTVGATGETELNLNLDLTPSVTLKGSASNTGDTSIGIFFERDY